MRYSYLGNTDLKVSALSLGTVAFGMTYGIPTQRGSSEQSSMLPPSDKESINLIHHAIDVGINFIDTARAYGTSEEILGYALHDRRDKVVLATKLGWYDNNGEMLRGKALKEHMEQSLTTSLRLLKTEWIDLLMLHSATKDVLDAGEAINNLHQFQEKGYVRYIGASTYGEEAPQKAIELGVNALQVAYNILDQRMADYVFQSANESGVGIVVRSVFLKGILTPRADSLPERFSLLKQKSQAVKQLASQLRPPMNRIEAALRFVLSNSQVSSTLVGVRNLQELETACRFVQQGSLQSEIISQLEQMRWDDPVWIDPSTWELP